MRLHHSPLSITPKECGSVAALFISCKSSHRRLSTKTKKSLLTLVNRDCSEFYASLAMGEHCSLPLPVGKLPGHAELSPLIKRCVASFAPIFHIKDKQLRCYSLPFHVQVVITKSTQLKKPHRN